MYDLSCLKWTIFGLSSKNVKVYLRQKRNLQEQELRELNTKLQQESMVNDNLNAEWIAVQNKLKDAFIENELQNLALKRVENSMLAIELQGDREVKAIKVKTEQIKAKHQLEMVQIEEKIHRYIGELESLVVQISNVLHKVDFSSMDWLRGMDENLIEIGKIESRLSVKKNNLIPMRSEVTLNVLTGTEDIAPDYLKQTAPESSHFWGDMQQYLSVSSAMIGESAHTVSENPTPDFQIKLSEAPLSSDEFRMPEPVPQAAKESPALSEEIMTLRNRYIVGKLAGKDLYAHDRQLIVAKNQVISPQVVELAERSGKLPDLIVDMKISELEDD